jgi:hypothetical protein
MAKFLISCYFISFLALIGFPAMADSAFQPGLWEIASSMEISGMPMPGRPFMQTKCYTPADVRSDSSIIPAVYDQECRMTDYKRSGNKLNWNVQCTGANAGSGSGEIVLNGQSYEGAVKLHAQDARLGPVDMVYHVKAHRIGACEH